jgi:cytochrome P450
MARVSLTEHVMRRVVEPTVLRFYQWRGDPVARLMQPGTRADPYPLYDELRGQDLIRSPLGAWATSSHAAAASILRDQRFSSSPVHRSGYRPPSYPDGDPRAELPDSDLLTMDPPDHTRLRRLVSSAFTPRAIAGLEPWIRDVTGRLLAQVDATAGFDLIDALAFSASRPRTGPSSGPGATTSPPPSSPSPPGPPRTSPARRSWP